MNWKIRFAYWICSLTVAIGVSRLTLAQAISDGPQTKLYTNATFLTCDESFSIAEAMLVEDDRILAVGSEAELRMRVSETTSVVDLGGNFVTPGLCDSHLHFVGLGQSLQRIDLREVENWEALVAKVEAYAKTVPPGTWIFGRGWHQSKWTPVPEPNVDGYPLHDLLSARVPDHPVYLTHASGHASLANQLAMQQARIDSETVPPDGGEILVDAEGIPIGIFRENAQRLFSDAIARAEAAPAEAREAELREAIQLAGQACLANGVTAVHDAGISFELAEFFAKETAEGRLPVRIAAMVREPLRRLAFGIRTAKREHDPSERFAVRAVKVSLDGALGPHGAWLIQPYDDLVSSVGLNTVDLEELQGIAELCVEHDWQLCVHAIGDRANQEALNVFERALKSSNRSDHRWRIEHAQHIDRVDLPRFAKLGVIPAMQANHCTSDALFVVQRLGMRRASEGAYMWRDLIDSGVIIPNGTDAPVEPIDPRNSLFAAVTRELENGEAFFPAQCMSRKEALWSYTRWPAIASFNEDTYGALQPGLRADFVVWDRDLLSCKPEKILQANVLSTWMDGMLVYGQL